VSGEVCDGLLCRAKHWLAYARKFRWDVAWGGGGVSLGCVRESWTAAYSIARGRLAACAAFDTVSPFSSRMIHSAWFQRCDAGIGHLVLPEMVDLSRIKHFEERQFYRTQLGIPAEAIVVLFSGTPAGKKGLMVRPEAAKTCSGRAREIVFVV